MLGQITNAQVANFKDLYLYEVVVIMPLCIAIIYLGLLPNAIINMFDVPTHKILLQLLSVAK